MKSNFGNTTQGVVTLVDEPHERYSFTAAFDILTKLRVCDAAGASCRQ